MTKKEIVVEDLNRSICNILGDPPMSPNNAYWDVSVGEVVIKDGPMTIYIGQDLGVSEEEQNAAISIITARNEIVKLL